MLRLSKSEIYEAVVKAAEKQRRSGETEHEARARFWRTPEGQRARKRLDEAPGHLFEKREDETKSESPITPAYSKLRKIGDEIRSKRPELSREEATAEAMKLRPDLLRRYQSERQEYIQKALAG